MKIDDVKMGTNNEYAGKFIETNQNENVNASAGVNSSELPTKFGMWSKVKSFLFQEINLKKDLVLELSPKEEKVLTEVHDFLFQEICFSGLFSLGKNKKNKDQNEQL